MNELAMLAPRAAISEPRARQQLPSSLFPKSRLRFASKFWFAALLIAIGYAVIAASVDWVGTAAAMVVVGLMYAHLVELQHECLHGHAFTSRRANRIYGFFCGLFMLSSYTYYKYEHLRHHASLGKPTNREFFSYRLYHLDSIPGLAWAAVQPSRYRGVARDMLRSVGSRRLNGINHDRDRRRIATEYELFLVIVACAIAFTAVTGDLLLVLAWLVPALAISEPVHFFIELPEHFGLDTQHDTDVLRNTRTINASSLARWFTNCNNLHTAHHFHQGVPMGNVLKLHEIVKDSYGAVEPSYWAFYKKVLRGEIKAPVAAPGR